MATSFTYDGKAYRNKGDHHVVAMPQATTVAVFTDLGSAGEDAGFRNQRGVDLGIKTRYEVHPVSDGTAVD